MTPHLVLVAGTTGTARIDGISAAGASPALTNATPARDAELLVYGRTAGDKSIPTSPAGTPTPAIHTRAARELVGFPVTVVDAGLERSTDAPTVSVPVEPGKDVRDSEPVPDAGAAFEAARELGRRLPTDDLVVAETIPGGTTTALGVCRAFGIDVTVSSSLPENPIEAKRAVVAAGFETSPIDPGEASDDPIAAVRHLGDPVLPAVAGLAVGGAESGSAVTLAGGTQMLAAAALVRALGVDRPLGLATTAFVAAEPGLDLAEVAAEMALDLDIAKPGFADGPHADHPAIAGYLAGEAKEGAGMGWALDHAAESGVDRHRLYERTVAVYERVTDAP